MNNHNIIKNVNEIRRVINLLENSSLMSLPSRVDVTDEQKEQIKALTASDIDFKQLTEASPIELEIVFPWGSELSEGINFAVQVTPNNLFQVHINITSELQHLGLGLKIYKSFIKTFGHVYSGKGRRFNDKEIPAIYGKLKQDPEIKCYENNLGILCVYGDNPDKEEIIKSFGS